MYAVCFCTIPTFFDLYAFKDGFKAHAFASTDQTAASWQVVCVLTVCLMRMQDRGSEEVERSC